ncbi:hypothetical protein [Limnoglobus roseus]|uniref:hypothetical protein n=1 Tax=Limnoglobus roseus TaxID=2598579 RepID=UPI0011EA8E73|nr:hypothetical protein [Limnoglobus roseus]
MFFEQEKWRRVPFLCSWPDKVSLLDDPESRIVDTFFAERFRWQKRLTGQEWRMVVASPNNEPFSRFPLHAFHVLAERRKAADSLRHSI